VILIAMMGSGASASAQFVDDFDRLRTDPSGQTGWDYFTGDGDATMELRQGGKGYASIAVDATRDRRGIWWALVKRKVSDHMDMGLLARTGYELRVEARIRVSHAPRRVNLHVNTQRTTDYHTHLMEFDIPDAERWHTISMTTHEFPAAPGDTVFGQLALMDWGLERYRVDLDYFKVDVVEAAVAGPDQGAAVPYHPPIPDPGSFTHQVPAVQSGVIDVDNPDVNLGRWSVMDGASRRRLLTVSGPLSVILRFDLGGFAGRRIAGHGLLELTTFSVQRDTTDVKDFGLVRVVEILGGDPRWEQRTVTASSLCSGQPLQRVLNSQMIIDWPITEGDGGKSYLTISRPVLQRLIDGRTLGIALKPLGSISASFYPTEVAGPGQGPKLLFDVED
jgi:hypothetical protein